MNNITNSDYTAITLIQAIDLYLTVNTELTESVKIMLLKTATLIAKKHNIIIA